MPGAKLNHVAWGRAGKPCVVFLHGFMGCARDWHPLASRLAPRMRCIAVDLPGHGRSVRLASPAAYTWAGACAAIRDVLVEMDLRDIVLAGYSMGARLALHLALTGDLPVRALILESGSPGLRSAAERRTRRTQDAAVAAALRGGDFAAFVSQWYRQDLFSSLAGRPALLARLVARRRRNDPGELARALEGLSVAGQPDLWTSFRRLALPILVVSGALDGKYAALAAAMAARNRNVRWRPVQGAGHNVHVEKPGTYLAAVRSFVDSQGGRDSN